MITALDTNVLFDVLGPGTGQHETSALVLEQAALAGTLIASDIVYAELCIHFGLQRECDDFLADNEIRVQPLTREALFLAGRALRTYRKRGGKRERILPDFLVGAHAVSQADRLLTRDRGFYGSLFPGLRLLDPSRPG